MLEQIVKKQEELSLNDTQFAALIGIPRETWQKTKTGQRPLSRRILIHVLRKFPELREAAGLFLLSGVPGVTVIVTADTTTAA